MEEKVLTPKRMWEIGGLDGNIRRFVLIVQHVGYKTILGSRDLEIDGKDNLGKSGLDYLEGVFNAGYTLNASQAPNSISRGVINQISQFEYGFREGRK